MRALLGSHVALLQPLHAAAGQVPPAGDGAEGEPDDFDDGWLHSLMYANGYVPSDAAAVAGLATPRTPKPTWPATGRLPAERATLLR